MIVGMPTTSFPTHDRDPSGAFVLGMARALARLGHRVEVLAPEPREQAPGPAWWTAPAPGVRVEWVPYARPRALQRTFHRAGAPENLARDPLAWIGAGTFPLALERAMRARVGRWDAIASHWGVPCGWVASRVAEGRPHVAFFHSGDVHALARLPSPLRRAIARTIARGATLAFVTGALRDRFLGFLDAPREAHVIPMGIDPIAPCDRARARSATGASDAFLLLSLSRLVAVKGLDRAIAAVAGMDRVELAIAGDGPERAHLEREAARRGARVRFLGVVGGDEKARWLAAADALIAPSIVLPSGRTEGAPTAVIEAMSAGLPVIASDAGGLAELVGHAEGGWIAEGARVDRLRDAIARLASDPVLRATLAAGARERAKGASWDAVAPRIDALLRAGSEPRQGSTRRAAAGGRHEKSVGGSAPPSR